MKKLFAYIFLCICTYGSIQAQFTDDFSDGNFSSNPSWQGNTDKFEVDGLQKLHLNAPAESSQAYLSTRSEAIGVSEWSWYCEISENPSSTNYLKVYLVSDQPQLDASLNGYFVKIGGTNDEVSLFRQDGFSETMLINGADGRVNTKPVQIHIKVNRDLTGNWTLQVKSLGESSFIEEGSFFDNTYTTSAYFGVYCQYTSTRSTAFYFDDFSVSGSPIPDNTAPILLSHVVSSSKELQLRFSEPLDVSTIMQKNNYALNSEEPTNIVYENDTVKLTFSADFPNAVMQQLIIKRIEDEHHNILADTSVDIFYFEKIKAGWGSLVLNEIFPDPTPSLLNLPNESDAEFMELYNPGPHPYNLENWNINGKSLPEFILPANEFLILCKPEYQAKYEIYGNVLSLSSWPSLSNTGGNLILQDDERSVIDSISYTSTDVSEGISLERIFIVQPCGGQPNFANSTHENGASPGEINTAYSNLADESGPKLLQVIAISEDSLLLSFNEKVYLSTQNQITVNESTLPQSIGYTSTDSSQFLLVFENELISNFHHQLLIEGAYDCSGNSSSQLSSSFYLDLQAPKVEQIILIDTAEILLTFSESLLKEDAEKESNYWILPLAQFPKKAVLENDSSSVRLTFSSTLHINDLFTLTIQNIEDLYGNKISSELPASFSFTYTSEVAYVNIVNSYQLDVKIKQTPDESSALNLQNYFVDREIGNPARVIMDNEVDGLIHLLFSRPLSPNKAHTLSISNLYAEDSALMPTPKYYFFYDTKGPKIKDIQIVEDKTFAIFFDEPIDNTSIKDIKVWINGDIVAYSLAAWNDHSIQLTLAQALGQETFYEIGLEGLVDLQSNSSDPKQTFEFLLDLLPPQLDTAFVYAPNQLMLIFHEAVLPETYTPVEYLEMLQPNYLPQQIKFHQLSPEKVLFTFDEEFNEQEIVFRISNFEDTNFNQLMAGTEYQFIHLTPNIGHLTTLSNQHLQLHFSSDISALGLTKDNFSLNGNLVPDSVVFVSAYQIKLWFEQTFNEFSQYEFSFNYADQQQSISFLYQDFVESVAYDGKSTIQIAFSIPLNATSAENIYNYSITTLSKPVAAVYLEEIKSVHLLFDEVIDDKNLQTLTIKNLKDVD
ncbi:lamin tail domain-containing protein [Catalinimonas sp. 4WD22]|uniref:lamin tail domain-containing protein n=1 Tax=Catalinimonas locisalis TaxID=3133978 RepID=UPI00310106AC